MPILRRYQCARWDTVTSLIGAYGAAAGRTAPATERRSPVLQVVDDRIADDRRQRIGGRMPGFAIGHLQPLALPIDVDGA